MEPSASRSLSIQCRLVPPGDVPQVWCRLRHLVHSRWQLCSGLSASGCAEEWCRLRHLVHSRGRGSAPAKFPRGVPQNWCRLRHPVHSRGGSLLPAKFPRVCADAGSEFRPVGNRVAVPRAGERWSLRSARSESDTTIREFTRSGRRSARRGAERGNTAAAHTSSDRTFPLQGTGASAL